MKFIEVTDRETNKPILINTEQILFIREFYYNKEITFVRIWLTPNPSNILYLDVNESYVELRKLLYPHMDDIVNDLFGKTL